MPDAWEAADKYDAYMGRWSRLAAPRFLAWARILASSRVLDVGCGTGSLSAALLAHGAKAVVGIDPSAGFVEGARRRVPIATFDVGDAQALAFPDASFDAAVSGLVLNFVPEPLKAAREMRRVVRRNGVVAAFVWDYGGKMEFLRHFWDAAAEEAAAASKPADEGARFPLCHPDRLHALFEEAGVREVETGAIDTPTAFRDFDDLWMPFLGGQGPAGGHVVALPEARRADLRERLRRRMPTRADGSIHLIARAWGVRGIA